MQHFLGLYDSRTREDGFLYQLETSGVCLQVMKLQTIIHLLASWALVRRLTRNLVQRCEMLSRSKAVELKGLEA